MPNRTSRSDARANIGRKLTEMRTPAADPNPVLFTIPKDLIPPPSNAPLEMDASHLKPGSGNIRPYEGPKRERMSDAPNFQYTRMADAPQIDRATGEVRMGRVMQHMLDPEKHIERTSNYPGATGMSGSMERMEATHLGTAPVPAYGGSTDARSAGTLEHRETREVWKGKISEARQPKGSKKPMIDDKGQPVMAPVHGAGLYDALMRGESIRSPVHTIIDEAQPVYGPQPMVTPGGQNMVFADEDAGGFGHAEPVQWEGHHRVAAAAEKQRELREAGHENWSVPVPYEMHFGTQAAMQAKAGIQVREHVTEQAFKRNRLKNFLSVLGGGVTTPKRGLGGGGRGAAAGTWNSKMY